MWRSSASGSSTLTSELDVPESGTGPPDDLGGPIVSRPVLGGLTHEYEGKAA